MRQDNKQAQDINPTSVQLRQDLYQVGKLIREGKMDFNTANSFARNVAGIASLIKLQMQASKLSKEAQSPSLRAFHED